MAVTERKLIEQGRVKCLCGRRATGTTEGGEPECDDLSCHAAEEIERVRHQLAGAVSMLEWLASLDDDEDARRAVTLQAIIDRAKATIGGQ